VASAPQRSKSPNEARVLRKDGLVLRKVGPLDAQTAKVILAADKKLGRNSAPDIRIMATSGKGLRPGEQPDHAVTALGANSAGNPKFLEFGLEELIGLPLEKGGLYRVVDPVHQPQADLIYVDEDSGRVTLIQVKRAKRN
jgi:hypothetical protein